MCKRLPRKDRGCSYGVAGDHWFPIALAVRLCDSGLVAATFATAFSISPGGLNGRVLHGVLHCSSWCGVVRGGDV